MLASQVRELIGVNGGVLPTLRMHGCKDCTHVKQYHTDLIAQGLVPDKANVDEVAEAGVEVSLLYMVTHVIFVYLPH